MSFLDLLLLVFSLCFASLASPLLTPRANPTFIYPGDAPFTVPARTLAAAVTCPNGNPSIAKPPVLLVHGTSTTGAQTWGNGYVPALASYGYTPCYVTLPGFAMGDMQVSSEYIAYALHLISSLANGTSIAVISHSQGGPDTQWALRFWPSTRKITRSFIALSPDFTGIDVLGGSGGGELSKVCDDGLCQPSLWQQSAGSHYHSALAAAAPFAALVPTTAIWTAFDGVVEPPQANAQLPRATVLSVQDLCPLRPVVHTAMTVDAAAFGLALDALQHGGIASLNRVRPHEWSICLSITGPHMSSSVIGELTDALDDLVDGFILSPRSSAEPPVMPYALAATAS